MCNIFSAAFILVICTCRVYTKTRKICLNLLLFLDTLFFCSMEKLLFIWLLRMGAIRLHIYSFLKVLLLKPKQMYAGFRASYQFSFNVYLVLVSIVNLSLFLLFVLESEWDDSIAPRSLALNTS